MIKWANDQLWVNARLSLDSIRQNKLSALGNFDLQMFISDIIPSFFKNIEFEFFHTKIKQNFKSFLTHNSLTQTLISKIYHLIRLEWILITSILETIWQVHTRPYSLFAINLSRCGRQCQPPTPAGSENRTSNIFFCVVSPTWPPWRQRKPSIAYNNFIYL